MTSLRVSVAAMGGLLSVVLGFTVAAQQVNDATLLERVLTGNSASRAKAKSYSITFNWVVETPIYQGPESPFSELVSERIDQGQAQQVVNGEHQYILLESSGGRKDGTVSQNHKHEAVLNSEYFGRCIESSGGIPTCEQVDLPVDGKLTPDLSTHISSGFWFNVTRYGFGTGDEYLQDAVQLFPEVLRWEIAKVADESRDIYKITRYTPANADPNQPDTEFFVDANAGYLITEVKSYERGTLWLHIIVQPREIAPGVWFPINIREERQGIVTSIDVTNANVGQIPRTEKFTWRGLGFDAASAVLTTRTLSNGEIQEGTIVDGVFVARS